MNASSGLHSNWAKRHQYRKKQHNKAAQGFHTPGIIALGVIRQG
jgi:hypothetical protein